MEQIESLGGRQHHTLPRGDDLYSTVLLSKKKKKKHCIHRATYPSVDQWGTSEFVYDYEHTGRFSTPRDISTAIDHSA